MIALGSQDIDLLGNAFKKALNENETDEWDGLISRGESYNADLFLVILDENILTKLFESENNDDALDDWLQNVHEWALKYLNPVNEPNLREYLLWTLWEQLRTNIIKCLKGSRREGIIPTAGGLLAFVGGLSRCIIIDYNFTADTPDLKIISVIRNPRSLFDFWGAIEDADANARNHLKRILSTGHKLVWSNGVLVHVDRRLDYGVFGPTIDTLLMAEIMTQEVFGTNTAKINTAFEIGCGNGFLSAIMALHGNDITTLLSLDIDEKSVACTFRNIKGLKSAYNIKVKKHSYIIGDYDPHIFNFKSDLIVCNPPYVPIKTGGGEKNAIYYNAIGGVTLITQIINNLDKTLNDDGRLLLMVNNLSFNTLNENLPSNYKLKQPLGIEGYKVIFDVEAVLEDQEWLDSLIQDHGLICENGHYFHILHPVWIHKIRG